MGKRVSKQELAAFQDFRQRTTQGLGKTGVLYSTFRDLADRLGEEGKRQARQAVISYLAYGVWRAGIGETGFTLSPSSPLAKEAFKELASVYWEWTGLIGHVKRPELSFLFTFKSNPSSEVFGRISNRSKLSRRARDITIGFGPSEGRTNSALTPEVTVDAIGPKFSADASSTIAELLQQKREKRIERGMRDQEIEALEAVIDKLQVEENLRKILCPLGETGSSSVNTEEGEDKDEWEEANEERATGATRD